MSVHGKCHDVGMDSNELSSGRNDGVNGKCHDVGRDSNELSSGTNEGVKTPRKKKQKTSKIGLTSSVRQRCAQRRRVAQEIIPSTFSLVKQLP